MFFANSQDVSQGNSTHKALTDSLQIGKSTVPEICRKEALPCTLSPLGFHLSAGIRERIWKGEFLDLLSLLPLSEDSFQRAGGHDDKAEEDRRQPINRTFNNWLQTFLIFASVTCEKFPEKSPGLFQHLDIILVAYKNFGDMAWFVYDESFRQKMAVHSSLQWGDKDIGLWLNLFLPQRPAFNRQDAPPNQPAH